MTSSEIARPNAIEQKGLRFSGSFAEYIDGFLKMSGNPLYTKQLTDSVGGMLKTMGGFEHKDEENGMMLTGSIARYLTGNGDPMTNWHIREKAKEVASKTNTEWIRNDFLKIANPDQDIDTIFNFTDGKTIEDLYTHLEEQFPGGTTKQEPVWIEKPMDEQNCLKTYVFTDQNGVEIHMEIGPIKTNPNVTHMAIGFHENNTRLFHIDIAEYPKTGSQAKDQKRQGGLTINAHDLLIPLHLNKSKNDIMYKINKKGLLNLNFKERIRYDQDGTGAYEQDSGGMFELAARALRIHLIHSPDLFHNKSAQSLNSLFFTKELFELRKRMQDYICQGNQLSPDKMQLINRELLISMILNPIETAKFLQDTGMYLLLPGMKEFNHQDWRNLYNADAFAVLNPGEPLPDKEYRRSLASLEKTHESLQRIRWNKGINGALLFIEAYGEVMKHHVLGVFSKNVDQTYGLIINKQFYSTSRHILSTKHELSSAIPAVLKCFPSGLTEREMQSIIERQSGTKISKKQFKKALFEEKSIGYIDRHNRTPSDEEINKLPTISFYSPRINNEGDLESGGLAFHNPTIAERLKQLEHPDISDLTATLTLKKYLMRLSAHTIESFRPMQKFDLILLTKEMRRTLQANNEDLILPDTIYRFFKGIQKFCIDYSRQRGL